MSNTSSNVKRVISNTAWMLFDRVFILLLNLIVTVRIANYYGSLGYGTYQYAISIVAIFEVFITFVDGRVVKKKYSENDPGKLVWNATIARLLFSAIAICGGILYILFAKEESTYVTLYFILLGNSIIANLRFGMQNRYEYMLKSKRVIIASNIALSIGSILQLIAVSLHLSILSVAIITAFSSMISLSIVYFEYRKEFGKLIQGRFDRVILKELIIESLPLAIAASCAIIYSRCDSIMIGNMLSKKEVGIYAIAVKLINTIQIAKTPISESIYPKMVELYRSNRENYIHRYIQVTAILTWVYISIVGMSFVILPYAFRILKPEYSEAFPIYKVYVIGAFFIYNAGLRAGHYTLIKRGNILMYSQIVSVILNIILNYVLIMNIGMYGAAIATGITQGISLMISNLFFGETGREVFKWQIQGLNPVRIFR